MSASAARAWAAASWAAVLAAALACASLVPGAAFLSDDFVQLANFGHAEARGRLGALVAGKLAASIDGVNGFWRPLTYATYASNHWLNGADARAWLAVNLALHLASAVLVGALVLRLAGREAAGRAAALFAGAVFFAFAPGWEAVLWIACRYDTLATCFTLLAGWCFAGGHARAALAATALALMAKESGSVAFLLVAALAFARGWGEEGTPAGRLRAVARVLAPFVALGIAYVALRLALFGHPTRAYVGMAVDPFTVEHWRGLAGSLSPWSRANFPGFHGLRTLVAAGTLGLLAGGFALAPAAGRRLLLAVVATLVACLALLVPHVPTLDPSGLGGRLFYLPGALAALALGLALQAILAARARHPAAFALGAVLALALAAVHLAWGRHAVREYRDVHREMRAVVGAIEAAARAPREAPAVLFIPDRIGRVAFGRNAQAGLVLPPVQAAPLSDRVLVQLDVEIGALTGYVRQGLFDALRRQGLFELMERRDAFAGARPLEPSAIACWSAAAHAFVPLPAAPGDPDTLPQRVREGYARAGCAAALARK